MYGIFKSNTITQKICKNKKKKKDKNKREMNI